MTTIPKPGELFRSEDGTVSVILPDDCDPDYEPSKDELEEYAEWLGIDPVKEPHLMWIAKEGLQTPLPEEWRACQTGDEIYYFNFKTAESLWDHPLDSVFKSKVEAEREKAQALSKEGKKAGKKKDKEKEKEKDKLAGSDKLEKGAASSLGFNLGAANSKANLSNGPLSNRPAMQPLPKQGRLGALGTEGAGTRIQPDVSDIVSRPLGSPATAIGKSFSTPLGSSAATKPNSLAFPSSISPGPGAKDIEAAMRKRIEEEYEPTFRALNIQMEKEIVEENAKNKKELEEFSRDQDAKLEAEMKESTSESKSKLETELRNIEEIWKRKIQEAEESIAKLKARLSEENGETQIKAQVEKKKKQLSEANEQELSSKRALLLKQAESQLKSVAEENEEEIEELESENERAFEQMKILEDREKTKALADLERQLLKDIHASFSTVSAVMAATSSSQALAAVEAYLETLTTDSQTIKKVEPTAVGDEKKASQELEEAIQMSAAKKNDVMEQCRREMSLIEAECQKKIAQARIKLDETKKLNTQKRTAGDSSLSQALKIEEDKLQKDLEAAILAFNQETELLQIVEHEKFDRESGGERDSSDTDSADSENWDEAGEVQRLEKDLQEMELRYRAGMDEIRAQYAQTTSLKESYNPRLSASYRQRLEGKKAQWLQQNPEPSPKVVPFSDATNRDSSNKAISSSSVAMSEQEQMTAAKDFRNKAERETAKNLERLEKELRSNMEKNVSAYREKKMAELKAQINAFQAAKAKQQSESTKADENRQTNDRNEDNIRKLQILNSQEQRLLIELQLIDSTIEAIRQSLVYPFPEEQKSLENTPANYTDDKSNREKWYRAMNQTSLPIEGSQQMWLHSDNFEGVTSIADRPPTVPRATVPDTLVNSNPISRHPQETSFSTKHPFSTPPIVLRNPNASSPFVNPSGSQYLKGDGMNYSEYGLPRMSYPNTTDKRLLHPGSLAMQAMNQSNFYNASTASVPISRFAFSQTPGKSNILSHPQSALDMSNQQSTAMRNPSTEERLQQISDALRLKKKKLRERQRKMEEARATWREDMAVCKSKNDVRRATQLKQIKQTLERHARMLNEDVLEFKRFHEMFKHEEIRYIRSIKGDNYLNFYNNQTQSTADLYQVLNTLLKRTEKLETLISARETPGPQSNESANAKPLTPYASHENNGQPQKTAALQGGDSPSQNKFQNIHSRKDSIETASPQDNSRVAIPPMEKGNIGVELWLNAQS